MENGKNIVQPNMITKYSELLITNHEILKRNDCSEAILIYTYWNSHVKLTDDVMCARKYVAFEVSRSQSIQ